MNNWFAAAAAGALAVFGIGGHIPTDAHNFNDGTSTHKEERDQRLASSTKPTVDIACVSTAVAAREASTDAAVSTYASAINTAYSTRASALASAYALTGSDAIRAAVKDAWKQFTSSSQGAKRVWQKSRETSWQTFRTAIKACGASAAAISDTSNMGSEMSGQ